MTKSDILFLLESETFPVYNTSETVIPSNQNGIIDRSILDRASKAFLRGSIDTLTRSLVDTDIKYPNPDYTEVNLETDFVVMKREDYNKVLKYIESNE